MRHFYTVERKDIFEYRLLKETPQYFYPLGSGRSIFTGMLGHDLRVRRTAINVCGTLAEAVERFEEIEQKCIEAAEREIVLSHRLIAKARGSLVKEEK